jgi:hypothetical protein
MNEIDGIADGWSNCCGARVWAPADDGTGICMDCKEWCEVEEAEEEAA